MKVIHLSDTHIGKTQNTRPLELLLHDLLTHIPPDKRSEHLIIHTGDLIDIGNAQQRGMGKEFLMQLRYEGFELLVCPGNHDCGNALRVDPLMLADFRTEFATYIFSGEAHSFPALTVKDNWALIGLDSNEAEVESNLLVRLMAEGHLGQAQLAKLDSLIEEQRSLGRKILVYLHHHPFQFGYSVKADRGDKEELFRRLKRYTRKFRRLKDAFSLCQILQDRTDILLFGHKHAGLDCSVDGQRYGIGLALDGGSSTGYTQHDSRLRYRIIDLDKTQVETRLVSL